jgi:hypothetical protein
MVDVGPDFLAPAASSDLPLKRRDAAPSAIFILAESIQRFNRLRFAQENSGKRGWRGVLLGSDPLVLEVDCDRQRSGIPDKTQRRLCYNHGRQGGQQQDLSSAVAPIRACAADGHAAWGRIIDFFPDSRSRKTPP